MPLNHNHVIYPNYVLEDTFEDLLETKLDLLPFCTIDNTLEGVPGMMKKINVYTATSGTENLRMGQGNTKNIEVSYTQREYEILLAQNRFPYYDEQSMTDPKAIEFGINHMATDMVNTINKNVYAEFAKATRIVRADTPGLAAFVDATSLLNLENIEGQEIFSIMNPTTLGAVRKNAEDSLKYTEGYLRTGFVGQIASIRLFVSNLIPDGTIVGGTREAVTVFNKSGTQIEVERTSANERLWNMYARKYYLVALTNDTKAFKILLGADSASANLSSLSVGSILLSPAFDPSVTAYTGTTKNASAKVTAAAESADATIAITLGAASVTNGSQVPLAIGTNVFTFAVTNGSASTSTTVTITREAA